jgi:hypothetical protein
VGYVGHDFFGGAGAYYGGAHRRVAQRELQGRRGQRDAVPGAGIPQTARAG